MVRGCDGACSASSRDQQVTFDLFLSCIEPGDRERVEREIRRAVDGGGGLDVSFRDVAHIQWRQMDQGARGPHS